MNHNVKELYRKWLQALRSEKYTQIDGRLYDGTGYCCLGVADKVCFNATFRPAVRLNGDIRTGTFQDDKGMDGRLYNKRSDALQLNKYIMRRDVEMAHNNPPDSIPYLTEELEDSMHASREDFLIDLNDKGYSFEQIADVIEVCQWDRGITA